METKPNYPDADRLTVFSEGEEYQEYIAEIFTRELGIPIDYYTTKYDQINIGESRQGIEVKLDNRCTETGNVSIEVAEKSCVAMPYWAPSGIMREDNTWLYVQGNYEIVYLFSKLHLRRIYKVRYQDKVWTPKPTIQTFLMPTEVAETIALKVIRP